MMDYFAVLGLSPDASAEEIWYAYTELSLKWNPVLFYGADSRDIEGASFYYECIKEAYNALMSRQQSPVVDNTSCQVEKDGCDAGAGKRVKRIHYSASFSKNYWNGGAKYRPRPLPKELLLLKYKISDKLSERLEYKIRTWWDNREANEESSSVHWLTLIIHALAIII